MPPIQTRVHLLNSLVLLIVLASSGCLKNIRPDGLETTPSKAQQSKGRALLNEVAVAHGLSAWSTHVGRSYEMRDSWHGLGAIVAPWGEAEVNVEFSHATHSDDVRARFLSGERQGRSVGIHSGGYFEVRDGAPIEAPDDGPSFILRALHYFGDFPFRIGEAEYVAHLGQRKLGTKTYDVVLASFGGFAPDAENDQYVLYIDPKTNRLEKSEYTIREFGGFFTGVIHFLDFKNVNGMTLAHRMVVTNGLEDTFEDDLHVVTITEGSTKLLEDSAWFSPTSTAANAQDEVAKVGEVGASSQPSQ